MIRIVLTVLNPFAGRWTRSHGSTSEAELLPEGASAGCLSRRPTVALQPALKALHENFVHNLRLGARNSNDPKALSGVSLNKRHKSPIGF